MLQKEKNNIFSNSFLFFEYIIDFSETLYYEYFVKSNIIKD